ncbi:3-deoxy-D-manno-octulosonic acid transferase [Yoonia sp. SDW83-1]|uniref:3-deoxy-D-manno-octulosonic acid transferase n=1 Tax=Yoonia sp. SDW83-1 TaxID=3366945 RepID=UPI00398C71D4
MPRTEMQRGWLLRAYLLASHGFPLIAPRLLRKRLARGKEDPARWREKLGQGLAPHPGHPLIWLHAVGLGEVLSLRGLIARLADKHETAWFLVTSTTAASAQVFARNLPPRTIHQFLPIDAPGYRRRFLDHFRPDLVVWAEQDIWPGFVSDLAARGVPQAIVAARMNETSFRSHRRAASLYRDVYRAMDMITAQDARTAEHLTALAIPATVAVTGSLKPAAPPLECDAEELTALTSALAGRTVWAVAPSHPADEAIAIAAHEALRKSDPGALLIIAPRFPDRRDEIAKGCDLAVTFRSDGGLPAQGDAVWVCDTFGDLGLVYRLCKLVLIGGTFSEIEGHNPWEAAILGVAIAHGPRVANFADDFAALDEAEAAAEISDANDLLTLLQSDRIEEMTQSARAVIARASGQTDRLVDDLLKLLENGDG